MKAVSRTLNGIIRGAQVRKAVLLVPTVGFVLLVITTAGFSQCSISLNGTKWYPQSGGVASIPYYFADGLANCGFSADCLAWQTEIHMAAIDWNLIAQNHLNGAFDLTYGGALPNGTMPSYGIVFRRVYFGDVPCTGGTSPPYPVQACDQVVSIPDGDPAPKARTYFVDVDFSFSWPILKSTQSVCIAINTGVSWGTGPDQADRRTTARHELGHALGLGHFSAANCGLMDVFTGCGTTATIDPTSIAAVNCIYGPGPCTTSYWGVSATTTPSGTVVISGGHCDCSSKRGGGWTYQLAVGESGGPFAIFKTLQDADWASGVYNHSFLRSYDAATIRMQVFDDTGTQVGEAFSMNPVDIVGRLTLVEESLDDFHLEAEVTPTRSGVAAVRWRASEPTFVTVGVYDVRGRNVRTLFRGEAVPGWTTVEWDGRDDADRRVGSGVFFVRVEGTDRAVTRKVVVVN